MKKVAVFGIYPEDYFVCEIFSLCEGENYAVAENADCPFSTLLWVDSEILCDEASGLHFTFLELAQEVEVV